MNLRHLATIIGFNTLSLKQVFFTDTITFLTSVFSNKRMKIEEQKPEISLIPLRFLHLLI